MVSVRRIAACLLLALGCVAGAYAQREYSPNFSLGAKAGAVASRFSFTPEVRQTITTGATFGLRARYIEESLFGLVGELNVTQRGWTEDFAYAGTPQFQYSRTLTYVQIPLLTHIYFGSERVKGFVNLGPEVGVMVADNINANFDYMNYRTVEGFPLNNRSNAQMTLPVKNKIDYGISAGAGLEVFANRRHSFTLEARYYFGIGNIFGDSKRDPFAASRAMSLDLTLGYYFRVI